LVLQHPGPRRPRAGVFASLVAFAFQPPDLQLKGGGLLSRSRSMPQRIVPIGWLGGNLLGVARPVGRRICRYLGLGLLELAARGAEPLLGPLSGVARPPSSGGPQRGVLGCRIPVQDCFRSLPDSGDVGLVPLGKRCEGLDGHVDVAAQLDFWELLSQCRLRDS
jgi:hypothetical protein